MQVKIGILFLILSFISVSLAKNACSSVDTRPLKDPLKILGKYVGKKDLLVNFAHKFKSNSRVADYFTHLQHGTTSSNALENVLAWQMAMFIYPFADGESVDTCTYSAMVDSIWDFEQNGNKKALVNSLELFNVNANIGINRMVRKVLKNYGCNGHYEPILEEKVPGWANMHCSSTGEPTHWKQVYDKLSKYQKNYNMPNFLLRPNLEKFYTSGDKTLTAIASGWFEVYTHAAWVYKQNMTGRPLLFNLGAKTTHFMEQIAFAKSCSCEERHHLLQTFATELSKAIKLQTDDVQSSFDQ